MNLQLVRAVYFQCAHSYQVKEWTKEQNLKEFGPCFSPQGHGHRYRLECFVEGPVNQTTGMIINLRDLDESMKDIVSELDGKFLDKDLDAFKNTVPTTEKIAEHLSLRLKSRLKKYSVNVCKIKLYETDDLWVECLL